MHLFGSTSAYFGYRQTYGVIIDDKTVKREEGLREIAKERWQLCAYRKYYTAIGWSKNFHS